MGKSPGKWIKTVLFGKKSSKSNVLKGREKLVEQKEALVASNFDTLARNEECVELENKEPENLLPLNQETDIVGSDNHQDASPDPEKIEQEEAATRVQAALRGYLARRAFRALEGIIQLQALIRGHLVRRQAVATLCCMYGIVKLQAHVRGTRARQSDAGFGMHEKCNLVKPLDGNLISPVGSTTKIANLSENSFIRMLLASSTTRMALRLQYVSGDPNLVQSWLERWSASHFWKPVSQPEKLPDSKSQRKLVNNTSNGEAQVSKPKHSNQKIPTTTLDSVSAAQAIPEFEKPKRNSRKVSNQTSDNVQENPQHEFEKVKRNLRKVHKPVAENGVHSEFESETPKQHLEKESALISSHGVSEEEAKSSDAKISKEETLTVSNVPEAKITPRISMNKEKSDMEPLRENTSRDIKSISGEEPTNEPKDLPGSFCNGENLPLTNGHLSLEDEDSTGNENRNPTRRSTLLVKQESLEEGIPKSSTIPSYMAATESAKAKLRAQGSPRLGQDGGERSNPARRHSLPSSTNGKISSHSPKMQKPVQASGKGGHKSGDKIKSTSRDGNGKLIQAEWRR